MKVNSSTLFIYELNVLLAYFLCNLKWIDIQYSLNFKKIVEWLNVKTHSKNISFIISVNSCVILS